MIYNVTMLRSQTFDFQVEMGGWESEEEVRNKVWTAFEEWASQDDPATQDTDILSIDKVYDADISDDEGVAG